MAPACAGACVQPPPPFWVPESAKFWPNTRWVPNLASHVLGLALRTVPKDWEQAFGIRPWLVETLVDSLRFSGHCYRAANWIDVGITTGRGRQDTHHQRHGASPKRILLYPLRTNVCQYLCAGS